jgi:predicted nuclease with TOPRIM domain
MLAKARRELEGMTKLRDEDLSNVLIVRAKLAEKTREVERLHAQTGRMSPSRGRPASYLERRGTSDLFVAAKTAALEQRALELEKRNSDLVTQVETLKGGAGIDDLNRLTAHQAWKDTVVDLEAKIKAKDAELVRTRSGAAAPSGGSGADWYKLEALLEEHANYRESVGGKLQALRSDKETLQKELHRKENEHQALELRFQTLQRRSTIL